MLSNSHVPALPSLAILAGLALALGASAPVHADSVLTFKYTPAPRAQIAVWIEDPNGQFLATVALTEATAFRGIGNRPGASNMNSGYRWPYGRREGVLPIWAQRRASAKGARLFPRVIFQQRIEGLASRTTNDQSLDAYYCLRFDASLSSRDQLDAVSCATVFSSDKGRYLKDADHSGGYAEPFEAIPGQGIEQVLPMGSRYPARMDVVPCAPTEGCYEHADVTHFADDVRAVMPEIDAVTIATPPGDAPQRVLFKVPKTWASGEYSAFIEVNIEGDYNAAWNDQTYPKPSTPAADWDQYSYNWGYPYRGQPSLVWKVSFTLGADGTMSALSTQPVGRSDWDYWNPDYGALRPVSFDPSDPHYISEDAAHSGLQRLAADTDGARFTVEVLTRDASDPPTSPDDEPNAGAGGQVDQPHRNDAGTDEPDTDAGTTQPHDESDEPRDDSDHRDDTSESVGTVADLTLEHDPNPLRAHEWVKLRMRAADSEYPLHAYQVRVATEPMTDYASFIRNGRAAYDATTDPKGPSALSLPIDTPAGEWIESSIGALNANTHYYVGVSATDVFSNHGQISVAEISTEARQFSTVTPCFVASVAYGSPLAQEVGVLRRVRDRFLMPQVAGRAWVHAYYRVGSRVAAWVRPHATLRAWLRTALTPLVALARRLD